MAKMRSPNYPAIGLAEAVSLATAFWNAEKRTAVPLDVAVKALGYKSASGPARTKLAALKKYGLLEDVPEGVRLDSTALSIIHPSSDGAKLDALREAAFRPELFKQLFDTHKDASDAALKSHLINRLHFSETGAAQVISAYRDTIKFAELEEMGYAESSANGSDAMLQENAPDKRPAQQLPAKTRVFSWPLSEEITAEVRLSGGDVTADHLDTLAAYLSIAKKALAKTT